jgi:hypothetical protein
MSEIQAHAQHIDAAWRQHDMLDEQKRTDEVRQAELQAEADTLTDRMIPELINKVACAQIGDAKDAVIVSALLLDHVEASAASYPNDRKIAQAEAMAAGLLSYLLQTEQLEPEALGVGAYTGNAAEAAIRAAARRTELIQSTAAREVRPSGAVVGLSQEKDLKERGQNRFTITAIDAELADLKRWLRKLDASVAATAKDRENVLQHIRGLEIMLMYTEPGSVREAHRLQELATRTDTTEAHKARIAQAIERFLAKAAQADHATTRAAS